jgi:hypothetical protein
MKHNHSHLSLHVEDPDIAIDVKDFVPEHGRRGYYRLQFGPELTVFFNETAVLVRLRDALDAAIQARQTPEVAA